ncbi:hypothetical protein J2732_004856 [Achromobacter deleyi]|jgi:hypothetical protein|nr:hypothetical protein [Achromobacter deleyi]
MDAITEKRRNQLSHGMMVLGRGRGHEKAARHAGRLW